MDEHAHMKAAFGEETALKPKPKGKSKPKGKKKIVKSKAKKPKKKTRAKTKRKAKAGAVVRTERLDMRLSKAEKSKITAKAKKTGLSITKIVYAAIAKL